MTYVRVARDQRGYETTLLLHAARPGDRPRVLYWYRSAPGVRVGRSPLDEEAIRTIEEQYPDIEFDWPQLFEEASNMPPEAERRLERPRRKAPPPRDVAPQEAAPPEALPFDEELSESEPVVVLEQVLLEGEAITAERPRAVGNPLLDRLVGREIATRLRARYAEVTARIGALGEGSARSAWQARADALNPDRWPSPEAILEGIQHADRLFDELKRELPQP